MRRKDQRRPYPAIDDKELCAFSVVFDLEGLPLIKEWMSSMTDMRWYVKWKVPTVIKRKTAVPIVNTTSLRRRGVSMALAHTRLQELRVGRSCDVQRCFYSTRRVRITFFGNKQEITAPKTLSWPPCTSPPATNITFGSAAQARF